jgi:hypothetical protein
MTAESSTTNFQPHWLAKTMAGCCLGLALAFVWTGFFAWYGSGGISATDKSQFNMWLVILLWLPIFSASYLFRSGRHAWLVLGTVTVLSYGLFFLLRSFA